VRKENLTPVVPRGWAFRLPSNWKIDHAGRSAGLAFAAAFSGRRQPARLTQRELAERATSLTNTSRGWTRIATLSIAVAKRNCAVAESSWTRPLRDT